MKKPITRILLSILVFFIFSCCPLKIYKNLPEVIAWEPEIAKFEHLDKTENYSNDAVLFAGSSSIRLWNSLPTDMAPRHVIQRGYGGAKLSDFAVYADRIFDAHKCRALVMFIANDITGRDQDKTPEEVRKLFLSVLHTFRKTHPKTPFFWIAITPTSSRWNVWSQVKIANDLIMKECNNHPNTYFIKTDSAFLNENGEPRDELFVADKLHLNSDGYKIWSGIIKGELDKVLK